VEWREQVEVLGPRSGLRRVSMIRWYSRAVLAASVDCLAPTSRRAAERALWLSLTTSRRGEPLCAEAAQLDFCCPATAVEGNAALAAPPGGGIGRERDPQLPTPAGTRPHAAGVASATIALCARC